MKIIIHSLDELLELSELVLFGKAPREVVQLRPDPAQEAKLLELLAEHRQRDASAADAAVLAEVRQALLAGKAEPQNLPTDIAPPEGYVEPDDVRELRESLDALEERDTDGALYDTRWHSEPKKLTDKGVFRARRGRDNDAYKAWLLEQAVEVAEAAMAPGVQVDLEALVAASQKAAEDASDSHVDLLNACRDFTTKHGHPAFTALKAAVAPDGDSGQGKTVQHLTPGERRLMQACIANYSG